MNRLVVGSVAVPLVLLFFGCSELRKDLPPAGGALTVHGGGWTDSTSSDFHGKAIRAAGWDMGVCKTCHGQRYNGGTVRVSCLPCHNQSAGPEHCATCHGSANNAAPPADLDGNTATTFRGVGAHQKHFVGGSLASPTACSECHTVPPSVYVAGHVDSPLPAEVPMGSFRARTVTNEPTTTDYDLTLPLFSPSPSHDPAALSCANTYCHGSFKNGNDTLVVTWTATGPSAAACGTCHGDVTKPTMADRALPKTTLEGGTHPSSTSCSGCHSGIVDANLNFIDKTKHINGLLNVFGQERDF